MSELTNNFTARKLRYTLLMTASIVVFTVANSESVTAKDEDRPVVWLEGGWHYEGVTGKDDPFTQPFFDTITENGFAAPVEIQNPTTYSYGAEGGILLKPEGSEWTFSVFGRYGRSGGKKSHHEEQEFAIGGTKYGEPNELPATYNKFVDAQASAREQHLIVDFQVGKDVGLGLFSRTATSSVNFGIRFAQFLSRSNANIAAQPDFRANYKYFSSFPASVPWTWYSNRYDASIHQQRSFQGIGPSLSWNNSAPLAGTPDDGEIAFDWGINAAVLFGRQKSDGDHEMRRRFYVRILPQNYAGAVYTYPSVHIHRSRSVTVPNIGGFAGLSYRFTNAKLSLGYRADFFFGAMDGGVDSRKTYDRGFYGPYATISIGLGG